MGVTVWQGDALEVLAGLADGSVDCVVTDPPYGLEFMGKDWDSFGRQDVAKVRHGSAGSYGKDGAAAMRAFGAWCEQWAAECLRVLKPGGHLLSFGGTRTWHRLACAVEDAGFEVRDSMAWLYGSGFPKSLDVSKAIDKIDGGDTRAWAGWGTALKPAFEPIVVARKPLVGTVAANVLAHGTGALNIDGTRVGASGATARGSQAPYPRNPDGTEDRSQSWARTGHEIVTVDKGRWPANVLLGHAEGCEQTGTVTERVGGGANASKTGNATVEFVEGYQRGDGWTGAELTSPVWQCVAGCPVGELDAQSGVTKSAGGRNANISTTSTIYGGGKGLGQDLDPDAVRGDPGYGDTGGASRYFATFPADAHAEGCVLVEPEAGCVPGCPVVELDAQSGSVGAAAPVRSGHAGNSKGIYGDFAQKGDDGATFYGDTGGASRFFPAFRYQAKAAKKERPKVGDVAHPTVKPLELMKWLVRLACPPGGVVLDPFAGSGSTAEACVLEGFGCIAIEREPDYLPLIEMRLTRVGATATVRKWGIEGKIEQATSYEALTAIYAEHWQEWTDELTELAAQRRKEVDAA